MHIIDRLIRAAAELVPDKGTTWQEDLLEANGCGWAGCENLAAGTAVLRRPCLHGPNGEDEYGEVASCATHLVEHNVGTASQVDTDCPACGRHSRVNVIAIRGGAASGAGQTT